MTLSAKVIEAMAATGCTVQQIIAAVKASEIADSDKIQGRREAERLRKRRQRERENIAETTVASEMSRGTTVTQRDTPSPPPSPFPDKEIPQTLLENNPSPLPPPQPFSLSAGDEFERFWEIYPNKVGKADARKKFPTALRKIAFEAMFEALCRYASKTDDRPWLNPATWLHQERWGDRPAAPTRPPPRQREPTAGDIFGEMSRRIEDGIANGRAETGSVAPDEHHLRLVSAAPKH